MLCQEYYHAYMFALRDKNTELASVILLEGEITGKVPLVYIDILSHLANGNWTSSKAAYEGALFAAARRDHFLIVKTILELLELQPGVVHSALLHSIQCESTSALITLLQTKHCLIEHGLVFAQEQGKFHSARILLHEVWNQGVEL